MNLVAFKTGVLGRGFISRNSKFLLKNRLVASRCILTDVEARTGRSLGMIEESSA
jgi:hypothetical protein